MEIISPELFSHLVKLAALELNTDEFEYLRNQINNQLKAIRELETVPLEADTLATSHGVAFSAEIIPSLRPDLWQPYPAPKDILNQSPEIDDDYIVVPDIPHTEL